MIKVIKQINKAVEIYKKGDFKSSLLIYKRNLNKIPSELNSTVYYNMGLCNYSLLNYKASENNFKKAINDGFDCGYELFLSLINQGNIEEANKWWIYRSIGKRKSYPDLPIKRLSLNEIEGKKILVLNEQGFGDEFLFSRIIKYLSKKCDSVSYQVYTETLDVFSENFKLNNVDFFVNRQLSYDFVMKHDGFCLSGDFFFDLINEDYKNFNTNNINFASKNVKFNIGVCWLANSKSLNCEDRSIDINLLLNTLKSDNIVSLQKDISVKGIINQKLNSFKDTLDVISSCREIYTVDTSVAHLAVSSGKRINLVYKDYLDWRWKLPVYNKVSFNLIKII
jgi:tetratricopeptide (TPR) repeat protein